MKQMEPLLQSFQSSVDPLNLQFQTNTQMDSGKKKESGYKSAEI